jgi:hypothetical protein
MAPVRGQGLPPTFTKCAAIRTVGHRLVSVGPRTRAIRGTSVAAPQEWVARAKRLRTQLGNKGGIGRYDRDGFVHIDNRPSAADWHPN